MPGTLGAWWMLSLKAHEGCRSCRWTGDGAEAKGVDLVTSLPRANEEASV